MKDGYYLSVYSEINPYAYIAFGDNALTRRHDHNISLWKKDGEQLTLIHYWELERITGLKMHDRCFRDVDQAKEFINGLLKRYDLTLDNMQEVWGTPGLEKNYVVSIKEISPYIPYHTLAHLYSGMLCETEIFRNENMIALAVDGGPDNVVDKGIKSQWNFVGCYSVKGKIKEIFKVDSPGMLWGSASEFFKLREGTLMALGSATTSALNLPKNIILQLIDEYINEIDIKKQNAYLDYVKKLDSLVQQMVTEASNGFTGYDERFTDRENHISIVMKIIQEISIRIMKNNIAMILSKSHVDAKDVYLSITGGYALNCPTNSVLMNQFNFKGFVAPPCVSDSGISLGIALYEFFVKMDSVSFSLHNAFHGNAFDNLDDVIEGNNMMKYIHSISKMTFEQVVYDIIEFPIVWFNDSAEIGPRALGNRSILADPRSEESREKLNKIKQREWWRPVAPIVMEEKMNDWFEAAHISPYMLHTFKIKENKVKSIPAIIHLDRTARVQTIDGDGQNVLYRILSQFNEMTGVPIICNTSLNDKGEPIIDTILEALNFALRKNFKVLYINKQRVELKNHNLYEKERPEERKSIFSEPFTQDELDVLKQKYNPLNLNNELIRFYFDWEYHDLFRNLVLTDEKDIAVLEKYYRMRRAVRNQWGNSIWK